MHRFQVIDGGAAEPAATRVEQWTCKPCEERIGIATSSLTQVVSAPKIENGRVTGGLRQWVCAYCWRDGVYTQVAAVSADDPGVIEWPE